MWLPTGLKYKKMAFGRLQGGMVKVKQIEAVATMEQTAPGLINMSWWLGFALQ